MVVRAALRPVALALVLALTGLVAAVSPAAGEVIEDGNLVVRVDGELRPRALPRDRLVPVAVRVSSEFATTDGSPVPMVRRVTIDLNRHGRLRTRGLARCRARVLPYTTSAQALRRCRGALIGGGRVRTMIAFPDMAPFETVGRTLAFNARRGRTKAVLTHTYAIDPLQATFLLSFEVDRARRGPFGTRLIAKVPRIAAGQGRMTEFSLAIGRSSGPGGRGVLLAGCALPEGLSIALFPLARVSFVFEDGRRLTTRIERPCRVRR